MACYHCSPAHGLTALQPGKPKSFKKSAQVYMTTLLPMALMYSVRNYEYTYGYNETGQIYFAEYFPNALEILYRGQQASLYLCDPPHTAATEIPNEVICSAEVPIISETFIPDACEALLKQERAGALLIYRYHQLSPIMLDWIRQVQTDEIRAHGLLHTPGLKADYYKTHYPESWALAAEPAKS